MVDDPVRGGYDDDRRLEAPFLTRALEAVLRLAEIYAAERDIQAHRDPANRTDPLGGLVYGDPISRVSAPPAASPSDSLTLAEPPGTAAQSGGAGDRTPPQSPGDSAPKPRRGRWTKGNSTSAQIRAGAVEFLRDIGRRAKGPEILRALEAEGLVISSKDPAALVSSRIGRSPLFDHTYEGYGLREWSTGRAGRPNGGE